MILTESFWRIATRRVLVTFGTRTVVAFVRLMCVAFLDRFDGTSTPMALPPFPMPPLRLPKCAQGAQLYDHRLCSCKKRGGRQGRDQLNVIWCPAHFCFHTATRVFFKSINHEPISRYTSGDGYPNCRCFVTMHDKFCQSCLSHIDRG